MQIYNDILSAINLELVNTNSEAKPTRIQSLSNLAYDKLVRYLNELERKEMILQIPLRITEKGQEFLQDYDRIEGFMLEMGLKYLDISEGRCMEPEKSSYRPIKFLDRMEGNNHIVLLYEDQKYADLIIARYISNGLEKRESCIFFTTTATGTDEPDTIEKCFMLKALTLSCTSGKTLCAFIAYKDLIRIIIIKSIYSLPSKL